MSEMVERVATAQAGERWASFDEEHRNAARDLARVGIAATRKPTGEMVQLAWELYHGNMKPEEFFGYINDEALK
jgi:hypothetical protein